MTLQFILLFDEETLEFSYLFFGSNFHKKHCLVGDIINQVKQQVYIGFNPALALTFSIF